MRQIQAPRQPKRAIAEPRLHLKRKRRDPPVICKILKADLNTFKRQRYRRGRSSVPKIEVAVYEIEGTNRKVKGSAFIICGNRTFAAFSPLGQSQGCQWREVGAASLLARQMDNQTVYYDTAHNNDLANWVNIGQRNAGRF